MAHTEHRKIQGFGGKIGVNSFGDGRIIWILQKMDVE